MDATADLFGGVAMPAGKTLPCLPAIGRYPAARFKRIAAPPPKNGPRRVRVVDSFAGGGGASNGIELALESLKELGLLPEGHSLYPDFAVNHDEPALAMHAANHPKTIHLPHNVWKVNMRELLGDDYFGLLWLSPDCRDHSPAKGGPITSRSVRDLAWVLVRWLKELPDWQRPWMIALENVPAFSKWSPLIPNPDGEGFVRDPEREGHIFHLFIREVCKFGYTAGWFRSKACEFGDPTIRDRLFLAFRRDGEEVDFPEPTHGDPKSEDVQSGKLEPWPVAADIIDFERPCPSIFMTKEEARAYTKATGIKIIRPLKPKTDARLAKGVKRHVLDAGDDAFVITCNHSGDEFRGQGLGDPFATVARARDAHGLVVPHVTAFRGDQPGRPVTKPMASATANSFIKRPGGASPLGLTEAALAPFISRGQHGGGSRPALSPLHTVAASDGDQNQVIAPYLVPRYGERPTQEPRSLSVMRPAPTPVPDGNGGSLAAVYLAQHNTGEEGHHPDRPVSTVVGKGCTQGVVQATFIKRDFGNSVGSPMRDPLGSVTAGGGGKTEIVSAAMLSHSFTSNTNGGNGDPARPLKTILAGGNHANLVTLPLMTAYYSTGGQHAAIDDPMLAVTTKDRFGLTHVDAVAPPLSPAQYAKARQVAEFLRLHGCWDGGDLVTVLIRGVTYIIVDIGMRMLTPRELARAQGFPDSYILAAPYKGKVLTETEQRHKIGNSVCRRPAAAFLIANYRPPLDWTSPEQRDDEPFFLEAAE